jgi:hypothetical protein
MSDVNLPWSPRTRQKDGESTERKIARKKGARLHPRSGAGSIKDDASTDDVQMEIKDANKSYQLKGSELDTLLRRAIQRGKDAEFVIYFTEADVTATIRVTRGMG